METSKELGETEGSCRNTIYSSQCGPVAAEGDNDVGFNVLGGRADILGTKNAAEGAFMQLPYSFLHVSISHSYRVTNRLEHDAENIFSSVARRNLRT